jgi:hypothetical protein
LSYTKGKFAPLFYSLFWLNLKIKMSLSKKAIEEFREIYYQEYGEKISNEKARLVAEGLLLLFEVIYYPNQEDGNEVLHYKQSRAVGI